jgi:hypothetical protein
MKATGGDLEFFDINKYIQGWRCGTCNCRVYPGEECNSSICIELRENKRVIKKK